MFQLSGHRAPHTENRASYGPDRPTNIGELINSLLRAGYSMKQIRAMYPGLFTWSGGPGG